MWSDLYDYYELRLSSSYSVTEDTNKVISLLSIQPELERIAPQMFRNAVGYPWVDLCVVKSSDENFACAENTWIEECNLISIVCSKCEDAQIPHTQLVFLLHLAQLLGWQLVHEENNEG